VKTDIAAILLCEKCTIKLINTGMVDFRAFSSKLMALDPSINDNRLPYNSIITKTNGKHFGAEWCIIMRSSNYLLVFFMSEVIIEIL